MGGRFSLNKQNPVVNQPVLSELLSDSSSEESIDLTTRGTLRPFKLPDSGEVITELPNVTKQLKIEPLLLPDSIELQETSEPVSSEAVTSEQVSSEQTTIISDIESLVVEQKKKLCGLSCGVPCGSPCDIECRYKMSEPKEISLNEQLEELISERTNDSISEELISEPKEMSMIEQLEELISEPKTD